MIEEPLELRLGYGPLDSRREDRVVITMRTPGDDVAMVVGFLISEGIAATYDEILSVRYCRKVEPEEEGNVIRAELKPQVEVDPTKWHSNMYSASGCGVCGKESIKAIHVACSNDEPELSTPIDELVLLELPRKLRRSQVVFRHTGGIHAAGLFDLEGKVIQVNEDVGRHNAVDKLLGYMAMKRIEPQDKILMLSGRAGFELIQKAAVFGFPIVAALGAPSGLAVDLAIERGMSLYGFVREQVANRYAAHRTQYPEFRDLVTVP